MLNSKVYLIILIFCYGSNLSDQAGVSSVITLTENELERSCRGFEFQFVTHPTNPQNYIICVPGGGIEMECAANQCFDERNPPCSTNCNPNVNAADQTIKDYCNNDDTPLLDRVPNSKDCESYYICVGKNIDPLPQKCPANQHFSEEHKTCLSYHEANCAASSQWCKRKKDGTRFPHTKCYQYHECQNERALTKSCTYGAYFDIDMYKCVSGFCVDDLRTPDCKGINDGVRMAHAKCHKYFVCLNQALFEVQCATGYYFDKIKKLCNRDSYNICNDI